MFAIAAVVAFAVAIILRITGVDKYTTILALVGLLLIAAHLAWGALPVRITGRNSQ